MNRTVKNLLLLCCCIFLQACLKGPHELPEQYGSDEWSKDINYNLTRLNQLQPKEGAPVQIEEDYTLVASVRADDRSGNFTDKIIIEDSAAGISLLINESSLYTRFPINKRVYLKLKGLFLGNRRGTLELGSTPARDNSGILQVTELPAEMINKHLNAGTNNWILPPTKVDIKTINSNPSQYTNRLVEIENIQLDNPYLDDKYALPSSALSIKLRACNGDTIWLRSSNYALFQKDNTPKGKGKIQAILNNFGGTMQLAIRDTNDLTMSQERCDGSPILEPTELSIAQLRQMYQGKDTLMGNFYIQGVVTSDAENKNFSDNTLVVQQQQSGIVLYLSSVSGSPARLGDSVRINIAGSSLIRYQGILELSNLKASRVEVLANGKLVQPVVLTIAQLNLDFDHYESVLVRINNAKITSGGFYGGNKTLSDVTGNIILYTSFSATFADLPAPRITKNFQGIATYYNDIKEIKIRHPDLDVQ